MVPWEGGLLVVYLCTFYTGYLSMGFIIVSVIVSVFWEGGVHTLYTGHLLRQNFDSSDFLGFPTIPRIS